MGIFLEIIGGKTFIGVSTLGHWLAIIFKTNNAFNGHFGVTGNVVLRKNRLHLIRVFVILVINMNVRKTKSIIKLCSLGYVKKGTILFANITTCL